jgi:hypothetical protein
MVRFGFFVFGEFWAAAKSAKHFADSLPRKLHSNFTGNLAKILNKKACPERSRRVLFYSAAAKNFKRCFCFSLRKGEGKRTKDDADTERAKRVEVEAARLRLPGEGNYLKSIILLLLF